MSKKITLPISGKEVEMPEYITRGQRNEIMRSVPEGVGSIKSGLEMMDVAIPTIFKITKEDADNLPAPDASILESEVSGLLNPEKKSSEKSEE